MELPISLLTERCSDVGFVNFEPDSDGKIRGVHLLGTYDKMIFRQLAMAGFCGIGGDGRCGVKKYSSNDSAEGEMNAEPAKDSPAASDGQTGRWIFR